MKLVFRMLSRLIAYPGLTCSNTVYFPAYWSPAEAHLIEVISCNYIYCEISMILHKLLPIYNPVISWVSLESIDVWFILW